MRIEEIRKNKGLKQKDLANILNLSRSTISSYEKGSRMVSIDTLVKISIIFNVDINYLIGTECISKRNGMIVNIS